MDAVTSPGADAIAAVALILAFASLIAVVILAIRQARLLTRYRMLLSGATGQDLETLLLTNGSKIEALQRDSITTAQQLTAIEENNKSHIQRTATVRFSAFPDTGSDLSFAIAFLDAHNNGFVISSLYGRTESRVYAKPVQNGTSTYSLSDEEKEALAKAMAGTK